MKAVLILFSCVSALTAAAGDWPVLRAYEGEFLRRVKMPVGGIGTGTVSLSGRGALVDWEIRNGPEKGVTPATCDAASGFWLRTETPDGAVALRLLEGPLDTECYEGAEGARAVNHGFPRFRRSVFRVAYPLAQVALSDPAMPVTATVEAMNPLVPGDADASGIPAALLRWKLVNETDAPLKVSVLGFLVNPSSGECRKAAVAADGLAGVSIGAKDVSVTDDCVGRVALCVPETAGAIATATKIGDLGWRIRMDRFWKQFAATGRAADLVDPDAKEDLPAVAVSVSFDLPAHAVRRVPFVLSWRFPHRRAWSGQYKDRARGPFDAALDVGNRYAVRFADEVAPAAELVKNLAAYEEKTVGFVRGVLASAAPDVVKEAALFNLSTLRSETCFRTADGHFFGWEGCFDDAGSCCGSCTHVWGYEHALVDLWPDLAKDMTELQYGPQMDARGHISFRVGLPLATRARSTIACADGQMQCAIKAYENWKKTGDDAWIARLYPKIRKSIEFCWIPGGWDADCDGVMEGCQHNTMDVEYYGPNPQMEFLYLAALKAVSAMADACDDVAFAKKCRGLYVLGSAQTERLLFNGSFYVHKVMPPKGPIAAGITYGNASDLADPDFQLAGGCLVDQLLGDYAARHVGLGGVADERHANAALDTILARNSSTNAVAYNCGRDYALPEEPALKMAWYPAGAMPKKPFPYYGENMTGFEYVVAANLVQRGRLAEAEKVVRDIRSRYDGRKRNPFDEAECGHHYVRALAAWSVLTDWKPSTADALPPRRETTSAGDWIVDPAPYVSTVKQEGDRLTMANGLVSRTLLLKPGVTTWSFRNLMTDEEYVRAPSPEATLTFDGKEIAVGGVTGMPVLGYTCPQDRARYQAEGSYRFTGWRERPIAARLEWKRRREWMARELPWPPKGREAVLSFVSDDPALPAVDVHYEIYDGAPIVAKWVTVTNTTSGTVKLDTYASEILRLAEQHAQHDLDRRENPSDLFAISEFVYGDASAKAKDMGFELRTDPAYKTQMNWAMDCLCRLVATPQLPSAATLAPGAVWTSHRIWEVAFDSSDRERRGLAVRRFWRLVAPWTDENPLIFHLTSSSDEKVREGIRQCVETGFETLLMSFGSGFDLESRDSAYRRRYAGLSAEAKKAGIAFGGYSLTASRSAGTPEENVQGGNPRFGKCPCLAAKWGQDYLACLKDFMREADFGIFENDGPYPGDTCNATNHCGHAGYADSFIAQWRAEADLYGFCRAHGIYVNQPDNYYLVGGSKNGMGYKEVNWSLPRDQQLIVERQNVYDGTWTKTTSMGWMFVPLAQYHGGGAAATVEPLKEHLEHYDRRFADLLGAGVQACWRGPRLFDAPETLALVRKWTGFYKKYRRVLTGDLLHLRRPDGRDWDGWLMCDAAATDDVKAIASLFNPTDVPLTREIVLPLHYAGMSGRAGIRLGEGPVRETALDAQDRARIRVTIPAGGYVHVFVHGCRL